MIAQKKWYHSKAVWGGIVAVAAVGASAIGFDVDAAAREHTVDAILQLVTAAGALMAIFGRIVATDLIE